MDLTDPENLRYFADAETWRADDAAKEVTRLRAENARLRSYVDAICGPPISPEEAEKIELDEADREAMAGIDIKAILAFAKDPANMTTTEAIRRLIEEARKHPAFDAKVIREAQACFDRQFE